MHDHPAGRQLRHARVYRNYRTERVYRRAVMADITPELIADLGVSGLFVRLRAPKALEGAVFPLAEAYPTGTCHGPRPLRGDR